LRISEAKRLINEGKLNINQISEAVGYDNIYYISSAFKKQTGMTLTEFSRSVRRDRL
ncbi:MAG: helix-turn-helix transcriptional regulator, partial [Clostridia bacterium]|nr:helix-turn-helix transcriptional regulator [Clostridia bacterium]